MRSSTDTMPEFSEQAVAQGSGTHEMYRDGEGWITFGEVGKMQDGEGSMERSYRMRGWEPLRQYGRFQIGTHTVDNPLEPLFVRGGAHEVPLSQIVANGWDRHPPEMPWCMAPEGNDHKSKYGTTHHQNRCFQKMIPVEFPQLAGHTPVDVPDCEFCGANNLPTLAARNQHMTVLHADQIAQVRMGEAITTALSPTTKAQMASESYVCGTCGAGFSGINALGKHVQGHREDGQVSTE